MNLITLSINITYKMKITYELYAVITDTVKKLKKTANKCFFFFYLFIISIIITIKNNIKYFILIK